MTGADICEWNKSIFDALDWLAAMCSHIPNHGEQIIRNYAYYSNLSRWLRQKEDKDVLLPLQSMKILYEPPHLLVVDLLSLICNLHFYNMMAVNSSRKAKDGVLPEVLKLTFLKKEKISFSNRYQVVRRFKSLGNQAETPSKPFLELQMDSSDSSLLSTRKSLIRISGLPWITGLFEIREDQDVKGAVSKFWKATLVLPLFGFKLLNPAPYTFYELEV